MILTLDNFSEYQNKIKNIIFDFGGVLFDIDYDLPVKAFKEIGLDDFDSVYQQSAQLDLFDNLETGKISNQGFIDEIKKLFKKEISDQAVLEAWNSILLDIPKERIDLVHKIKRDYRTFILSNTNAIHVEEFEKTIDRSMGLEYFKSAFEKVHYSNVLGMKKPYPKTYIDLCGMHNLSLDETLFIDDSIQHVEGASEAGLFSIHLDLSRFDVLELFAQWK